MSPDPVFVPGVWGPYRDVLLPGRWLAEGGQSATGELLRHVVESHPAFPEALALADSFNTSVYDALNEHLRELQSRASAPAIPYLARHLFFYGDLFGNRSPLADPAMTGALVGLTADKSLDALALHYYAALEFLALQTRQILDALNAAGHTISAIFMSGSQCQNPILMDLLATACAVPVVIPRYVHAAVVHGAAMLGAKAASADAEGRTEGLWQIMDRMSKPGKAVYPGEGVEVKRLLEAKYRVFLEQCETQRRYRREVDEAVGGWGKKSREVGGEGSGGV